VPPSPMLLPSLSPELDASARLSRGENRRPRAPPPSLPLSARSDPLEPPSDPPLELADSVEDEDAARRGDEVRCGGCGNEAPFTKGGWRTAVPGNLPEKLFFFQNDMRPDTHLNTKLYQA
jgi:hypothetical protein